MNYARQKLRPFKKPRSIAMVHVVLSRMELVTCKDEPFLLVNDTQRHISRSPSNDGYNLRQWYIHLQCKFR